MAAPAVYRWLFWAMKSENRRSLSDRVKALATANRA